MVLAFTESCAKHGNENQRSKNANDEVKPRRNWQVVHFMGKNVHASGDAF
jgi:hypothetical protein